ncbi:membrane protein [Streptomyces kurssanovii]|nr:membrane protein [Streptomyces kurssanovii]
MAAMQLTRTHRILIGVVVAGALIIAAIGFAGSYAAVRELAEQKGFGDFSLVFPIGIDAGICVLLALDLLLTWMRIPFPLLRQTAWLLTFATIAFNGAAAWPDPLGVGMHAVIPILFVVAVEAARHAVGRIADITADKHMEGVRLTRWLLSPVPTFKLWRRMKLWELRSYEQVIKLEQDRLIYQARLQARFGRAWRRKAPIEALMPLRLAKFGVPLAQTAPAGLAAAGIEPVLLPPAPRVEVDIAAGDRAAGAAPVGAAAPPTEQRPQLESVSIQQQPEFTEYQEQIPQAEAPAPDESPWLHARHPQAVPYQGGYNPLYDPEEQYEEWYKEQAPEEYQQFGPDPRDRRYQQQQFEAPEPQDREPSPEETGSFPIPVGPGRTRELGNGGGTPEPAAPEEESYYQVFKKSINGSYPTPREFIDNVEAEFRVTLPAEESKRLVNRFTNRHAAELEEDHIA